MQTMVLDAMAQQSRPCVSAAQLQLPPPAGAFPVDAHTDSPAAWTPDAGSAQPLRLQLPAPGLPDRDPAPVERNISTATTAAVRLSDLQIMPILSPCLRLPSRVQGFYDDVLPSASQESMVALWQVG